MNAAVHLMGGRFLHLKGFKRYVSDLELSGYTIRMVHVYTCVIQYYAPFQAIRNEMGVLVYAWVSLLLNSGRRNRWLWRFI